LVGAFYVEGYSPGAYQVRKRGGTQFHVQRRVLHSGDNGIEIGDGTIFAPGVKIISANHDPQDLSQWKLDRPIKIGKNCWIGANAVILPGVELGDNVIVGAGAVVTNSFPDNVIVAGNPATIVKHSHSGGQH